ncbi:hypothetical protein NQ317_019299 [Molorchus minor]|uniref:Transposase domain-containing protein n=1 Tax=Molorchus minor TaxID=1323400 RepID=A0ABQ9J7D5_9CUCU|nr:hypothetical protein NQ317_019299 [Molorchus minor]
MLQVVGKRQLDRRISKEVILALSTVKNHSETSCISLKNKSETQKTQECVVESTISTSIEGSLDNDLHTDFTADEIDVCDDGENPDNTDILHTVLFYNNNNGQDVLDPYDDTNVFCHTTLEDQCTEQDTGDISDNLKIKLRQWALNNKVPLSAVTSLLHILSPIHPQLPLDARSLLKTPTTLSKSNKKLDNGEYIHLGLLEDLTHCISSSVFKNNVILVSFNIDGLPLFNNSNIQVWPILALIKNASDTKPFAVGIFCGRSKPKPLELYLEDFINELLDLLTNGVFFNDKLYKDKVHSFVCDAPARAFIKCVKSHSGYSSCDKCIEVGNYVKGRVIFNSSSAKKRSDQSFITQEDEDHHTGTSPLLKLNIGLVSKFSIDYMHCICLGVMKKLL